MFHMTADGPKVCTAKKRACPLGADNHFETEEEAIQIYERRLELENGQPRLSKRTLYSKSKRALVLSDIDGTLVDGSLVLEHAVYLHENGEIDLGDIPERWMADQKNEHIITELAEAYRSAIIGRNLRELKVREYMEHVMERGNFYTSLERLQRHKAAGHEVVLVSGSPTFLVGEFAKRFGFTGVGTKYHMDRTRRLNGRITKMFHAEAKKAVVEKIDPSRYDLVVAYGDTASDKPLLDVADHAVLVAPTNETLKKVDKVHEIIVK